MKKYFVNYHNPPTTHLQAEQWKCYKDKSKIHLDSLWCFGQKSRTNNENQELKIAGGREREESEKKNWPWKQGHKAKLK